MLWKRRYNAKSWLRNSADDPLSRRSASAPVPRTWSGRQVHCTKRRVTFPQQLDVVIDHPRASLIKRREDGRIDFISPLPCPFNYGSVPGTRADDGDREDAIVLGPRLAKGTQLRLPVVARAHFYDAGQYDAKWICGPPLSAGQRAGVIMFFMVYAHCKQVLNWMRGLSGTTSFQGLELAPLAARR